jgi:P-type Cu+ transporter
MMDSDKNRITRLRLRIIGVQCSTCIIPVRRALERMKGVSWVGANVILDLIFVDYDPGMVGANQIVEAIKKAGYTAVRAATV